MKFSLAIAASMAASAIASPVANGKWGWSKKGQDKVGKSDVFTFTSTYEVWATPDQVVNMTNAYTGGLAGASGLYKLGLNSKENTICYNITLYNFRGEYQSPAVTATHLHESDKGKSGPPRIAFPNPQPIAEGVRRSVGCIVGPFRTGLNATGTTTDTGANFNVAQIEANPKGFNVDVHSSLAVPGAVRGQLSDCK